MRLIDADALKKSIPATRVDGFENCRYCSLLDDEQIKRIIDDAPSIDAVPKGRWIAQKGGGYCCSECGSYSLDEVDGAFVHVSARTRYCHNCGARMDERKES